ncbi:uncharacterized protein si:dkey-1h24.6 [Pseudoliparis swirei]|uniref:uncharacterized protein si:dkey-1h24.6 n=1 Tax=Pseudoliparis swirei TaxID=2059687 RepID=UPI0024BE2D98|nr:uncharacterized protein si:dkey-1h24.6 [Pseudoliparis swirei]
MRACWMLLMLLSCRLSHAAKSQESCACKDQITIVCVPAGGDVLVPCPKLAGEDMIFNLFKDDEVIRNHTCIGDTQASDCKPRYTGAGVKLLENTDNNSFSFTLTGVKAGSYGIYGCEGTRMFPPPFVTSTLWMLLLVEGHQCNFHQDDRTPGHQYNDFLWIWILGLALLGTYSLTITIIILVKWRTSDSQRDYVNTRPKTHKDRRKKRGL